MTALRVSCNNKSMTTTATRVAKHRKALRKAGMRPIQIWVPDTRSKKFQAEARRQSRLIAKDPHEKEILDWMEATADDEGWR